MAAVSASTRHILTLQSRGFNYAQIGRATGVNRSLIRQIARGEKPGRNLTSTLRVLVKSEAPAPPKGRNVEGVKLPAPRRKTTGTGERAAVRQKEKIEEIQQKGQRPKEGGLVDRRTAKAGVNAIRTAAAKGQNVKITLKFKQVKNYAGKAANEVPVGERGGIEAQWLLDKLDGFEGSDAAKFAQLAEEIHAGRGLEVSGFDGITVARFDVDRRS